MACSSRAGVAAFNAAELDEIKRTLVTACHVLDREGITDGYGHVSARVPGATARLGELLHLALLHGEPRYLSADELETFSMDERFPARGWEYYVNRLGKRGT